MLNHSRSSGRTVLIVNDDLLEAVSLSAVLMNRGYHTMIADSAEAAFEMTKIHDIHHVLIGDQEVDPRPKQSDPNITQWLVVNQHYPTDCVWGRLTHDDQRPIRMD
jgi:hypothetical protein